jgi:SM-20-related protein
MFGPIPPHAQLRNLLPAEELQMLLDWALAGEQRFKQAKVNKGVDENRTSVVDQDVRIASVWRDLGPVESLVRRRLLDARPDVMRATGITGTEPRSLELELAAHGDGAHYGAHVDIPIGPDRLPLGNGPGEDRVISAILYFHAEPKGFSGGQLRLYRFGVPPSLEGVSSSDYVDLEPDQNSLVAFPSWARHEVRQVECPGDRFRDRRFALNCWFCRPL